MYEKICRVCTVSCLYPLPSNRKFSISNLQPQGQDTSLTANDFKEGMEETYHEKGDCLMGKKHDATFSGDERISSTPLARSVQRHGKAAPKTIFITLVHN